MSFSHQLAENGALFFSCVLLGLAAIFFFAILYAIDFKEGRQKAKKRRQYERTLKRNQKNNQNRARGNILSRDQ